MIDKLIAALRAEGEDDIAHRDRCQVGIRKNENDGEDLGTDLEKAEKELGRLEDERDAAAKDLEALDVEINKTKTEMEERLAMRNQESKEFAQALNDDADAIEIIGKAIEAISKFYKDNKLPL